jgi:PIN domain nuclease of toxin-antitoxin system
MAIGLLLDTHALIWLASGDPRVTGRAHELASDPENALWLSVASIWEMAIKASLGKLDLKIPIDQFVQEQTSAMSLRLLEVRAEHALAVAELAFHHRDPFDRLLVAQAQIEQLHLLSRDVVFDDYFDRRVW